MVYRNGAADDIDTLIFVVGGTCGGEAGDLDSISNLDNCTVPCSN